MAVEFPVIAFTPDSPPRQKAVTPLGKKDPRATDIGGLVDHMFQDVFTEVERRALRERIGAWEAENPGMPQAERVMAWIDIAYQYQMETEDLNRPESNS